MGILLLDDALVQLYNEDMERRGGDPIQDPEKRKALMRARSGQAVR